MSLIDLLEDFTNYEEDSYKREILLNGYEEKNGTWVNETYEELCENFTKKSVDYVLFEWEMFIAKNSEKTEIDEDVRSFMYSLFDQKKYDDAIYIMVKDDEHVHNEMFYIVDDAIKMLSTLCKEKYNLYFTPAHIAKGAKRFDKNCKAIQCIFCDIDEIEDFDVQTATQEEISNLLQERYEVPADLLPDWVCVSGHGLHLYWLLQEKLEITQEVIYRKNKTKKSKKTETAYKKKRKRHAKIADHIERSEGNELRRKYTESIITHFHADRACMNESRILRFPKSLNVKNMNDVRQTKLFRLADREPRLNLSDLDYFLKTDEEIKEYKIDCADARNLKAFETRLLNHNTYEEIKERNRIYKEQEKLRKEAAKKHVEFKKSMFDDDDKKENEPIANAMKTAEAAKVKKAVKTETVKAETVKKYEVKESERKKTSHDWNLLHDLEEYASKGLTSGYRNIFCFIYATVCKRSQKSLERALEVLKYVDTSFQKEAQQTVQHVYSTQCMYYYKDETIADTLAFTEYEKEHFRCAYTAEKKAELKRERNKKYNAQKRQKTLQSKTERNTIILNSTEKTAAELAEEAQCSVRTVYNVTRETKKAAKVERDVYILSHLDESNKTIAKMFECSERTVIRIKNKLKEQA